MTRKQLNQTKYIYIGFVFTVLLIGLFLIPKDYLLGDSGVPFWALLPVFFLAAILPLIYLGGKEQAIRRRELKLAAHGMDWEYSENPELSFLESLAGALEIYLAHPLKSVCTGGVQGKIGGLDFVVFDGEYRTGSGKNSRTHTQTIFCLGPLDADLPVFGLEPVTFRSRVHDLFAGFDIDFEKYPEFSKTYALYGQDRERIRQLFTDDVMDFFVGRKTVSVFADRNRLIMYRKNEVCGPETLDAELNSLVWLARLLSQTEKRIAARKSVRGKKRTGTNRTNYW
jgi:hypothetical protein